MKILVSPDDFVLLLKKFLKDSYVVNYVAFIAAIDEIVKYLDEHGVMNLSGVINKQIHYNFWYTVKSSVIDKFLTFVVS